MTTNKLTAVYISLGSNIEPEANLVRAIRLLGDECPIQKVSSAYITPPHGFTDQADFWNAAVRVQTLLTPLTLKQQVLDAIERKLGRQRDPNNKNAPRTIDLDISLWNDDVLEYGDKPWHIPDPDILRFAHVAIPLAEIAPHYIHPIEKITLAEIAVRFSEERSSFSRQEFWTDG